MNTYFDNAATSFPKAPGLGEKMACIIESHGVNINRGAYKSAYHVATQVLETREKLSRYFGFSPKDAVLFTKNITESINLILYGLFGPSDHVIVSAYEHNALMRPLHHLSIPFTTVYPDENGFFSEETLTHSLQKNTKAIFMTHASNVTGTLFQIESVYDFAKAHGLWFILDGAQTAGYLPKAKTPWADIVCFTGHKHLLGPQGIGGFLTTKALAQKIKPFICGGTGSLSEEIKQPDYLPDKFEAGTQNIPGILGLHHALSFLEQENVLVLKNHQDRLMALLMQALKGIPQIRLYGTQEISHKVPLVSFGLEGTIDQGVFSHALSSEFDIALRCGLHCAPCAHQALGTLPVGTLRLSLSPFHEEKDILYLIDALTRTLKNFR